MLAVACQCVDAIAVACQCAEASCNMPVC
jgi:hypothetical protein